MRVWTFFRVEDQSSVENAVHKALASAMIEPVPYDPEDTGPGLVVFDAVSAQLCAFLREVTRRHAERVLAVGASRSAFNVENCWQHQ